MRILTKSSIARFWAGVVKTESCWLWTKYLPNGRYGAMKIGTERILVHIFSYMLHSGTSERPDLNVLHKCDVTNCVNPEHLFLGTQEDNVQDSRRKNRWGLDRYYSADLTPRVQLDLVEVR